MTKENRKKLFEAFNIIKSLKHELLAKNILTDKELKHEAIDVATILGMIGQINWMHNYKYREVKQQQILSEFFASKSSSPHGVDVDAIPPAECKTLLSKTKDIKLSENTDIGQIDKVTFKIGENDPKYSPSTTNHAVFSLYKKGDNIPAITFYVDNKDWGTTVQPLIRSAAETFIKKSNGNTVKTRDSITLKLKDFMNCSSLEIIQINPDVNFSVTQEFINNSSSNFKKSIMTHIKSHHIKIAQNKAVSKKKTVNKK